MKRILTCLLLSVLAPVYPVFSQEKKASPAPASALIVFDASGSMWGQIKGKAKIEIARDAVGGGAAASRLLRSVPRCVCRRACFPE